MECKQWSTHAYPERTQRALKELTSLLVASKHNEFITGSLDGTIRLWDMSTGCCKLSERADIKDGFLSNNLVDEDSSMVTIRGDNFRPEFMNMQVKQISSSSSKGFLSIHVLLVQEFTPISSEEDDDIEQVTMLDHNSNTIEMSDAAARNS